MGCVYRLTAPNGKAYIGITLNFQKRMKEHACLASTKGSYLIHKAIRKYGWTRFTQEILFESEDPETLKAKEIELIAQHHTHLSEKHGYNMTWGGDGVFGYRPTPETRERLRQSHLGKRHSEESKRKMAEAHRGRKNTPEHNQHISAATLGHPSYKKSGTPCAESTRKKLSEVMTGKVYPNRKKPAAFSEEHRQKLREGQARRRAQEQKEKENATGQTSEICNPRPGT